LEYSRKACARALLIGNLSVLSGEDGPVPENHVHVDQVLSHSRKTDKIASSDVAHSRANCITFHAMICLMPRRIRAPGGVSAKTT